MEVKYRIIDVDPNQHSIVVRYYTDVLSEDSLATSFNTDGSIARNSHGKPLRCQTDYHINIWKTDPKPTLDDIKTIANDSAPYDWFKLKHDILDPNIDTSLSEVSSLMNEEFVAQKPMNIAETAMSDSIVSENIENEIQRIIDSLTSNSNSSSANT